ncbi:MAG TPA: hypothetical protein VFO71_07475 [Gemmatimonadales bacterium]|nr:hypothetical protein [Gemmatimonadales bacterium]
MSLRICGLKLLALSVLLTLRALELPAQTQIISLAATAPGNLTVTIQSGGVQTIAGIADNAVTNFPSPVVIQTGWNLNPGQTNTVDLVAYFSLPVQAMAGGSTLIPASRVLGRMTTGLPTTFTAIAQNGIGGIGPAGGSLHLFSVNIGGANKTASRTDNLDLQLNLVGFPPLPAGTYAGVLNIRAVTQ